MKTTTSILIALAYAGCATTNSKTQREANSAYNARTDKIVEDFVSGEASLSEVRERMKTAESVRRSTLAANGISESEH